MPMDRVCACGCVPADMLSLFQMAELRAKKKKQEKELNDLISTNLRLSEIYEGKSDLAINGMGLRTEQISCKSSYILISPNLVSLYLDNNLLDHFPCGIFPLLVNLKNLALHNNMLTDIPSDIGELQFMEELRLDNNRLETIPEQIGNCASLTLLHISGNISLMALPSSIGNLYNLHHILMEMVSVTELPISMYTCKALEFITFDEGSLLYPPPEVVSMGGNAIRMYMLQEYNKANAPCQTY